MSRRFPALGFKNFRIFIVTQLLSLVGSWMQVTVLPVLAFRLTNQPIYLGAIGFVSTLPSLLLLLPAGVVLERLDKRRSVLILQVLLMLQALILGFLTISGRLTIIHMLLMAGILGIINAFEITARQAMFIDLVDKETLANAIGINATIFNAARVIGPALSAPLVLFLQGDDLGWIFILNGISYLIVIAGLTRIQNQRKSTTTREMKFGLSDLIEGQKYVWRSPTISTMIAVIAIPSFFGFAFPHFIPAFVDDVLSRYSEAMIDPAVMNSFMISIQGIGALLAALTIALFSTMKRKTLWLVSGQFAFSIGLILLVLSKSVLLTMVIVLILGWGLVTQLSLTNTIIQICASDEFRGRVISSFLWVLQGVFPFGSIFLGFVADRLGIAFGLMLCGICCTIGFIIVHLRNPKLRQLRL